MTCAFEQLSDGGVPSRITVTGTFMGTPDALHPLLVPAPRARRPHPWHGPGTHDWQEAYHGGNYPRTQRVKAACDPEELFTFPQAVTCGPAGR